MSFSITGPLYPRPTYVMSGGSSTAVNGQLLTITSTATVQFAAFADDTKLVTLDIQTANVYCTFDGQTPSATKGHILVAGEKYTWSKPTATYAKFVATSTTNATIWGSEFTV
jgi:hypothetical protein